MARTLLNARTQILYVDTSPTLGADNVQDAIDTLKGRTVILGGDLAGDLPNPTVVGLTGTAGTVMVTATALNAVAGLTVTSGDSATITVVAGNSLAGTGGSLNFGSGDGAIDAGNIGVSAGFGEGGAGGQIQFAAGDGGVTNGGSIFWYAGSGPVQGGDIELRAGSGNTGGHVFLTSGAGATPGIISLSSAGTLALTTAFGPSLTLDGTGADLNSMAFTRVNGDVLTHIDSGAGGRIQLNTGALIAALDDTDGSWRVDVSGDAATTAGGNIALTATNVVTIASTSQVTAITLTGYDIVFDSIRGFFRQNIPQVSFAPLLSGNDFAESIQVPNRQLKSDNSTVKVDWSGTDLALTAPGIISLTSTGNLSLNPATDIIDCNGAALINIGGGGTFLPGNGGSTTNFTINDSATITLSAAGNLILKNAFSVYNALECVGDSTIQLGNTDVDLTLPANSIGLTAVTGVNITAGSNGYYLDATGQSTVRVTGADMTIETITSGNVAFNSAGTMTLSAGSSFDIYSSGTGYPFRSFAAGGFSYVDIGDSGGLFDFTRIYGGIGCQLLAPTTSIGASNSITAALGSGFVFGYGNTVNTLNAFGAGAIGAGCSISGGGVGDGSLALCQSTVTGGLAALAVNQGRTSTDTSFSANVSIIGGAGVSAAAFNTATATGARSFVTNNGDDNGNNDSCVLGLGAGSSAPGQTAIAGTTITIQSASTVGMTSGAGMALTAFGGNLTLSASAALTFNGATMGYFGATPVGQQTGGAATAGALYTSAEQGMLNRVYSALRAYGLLT